MEKEMKHEALQKMIDDRRDKTPMLPGRCAGEAYTCSDNSDGRWTLGGALVFYLISDFSGRLSTLWAIWAAWGSITVGTG